MTEFGSVFSYMFFKCLMVCSGIAGVVFLAYNDKPGWGWLIFVLVLLSSTSFKWTPNETKEKE